MDLDEIKKLFDHYMEAWGEQRKITEEDLRFGRLGEQWTDADKRIREADDRPLVTENNIPAFIRQVINDARQNTPQIKVHPIAGKSDQKTSEIMNGLIRNIEMTSDADQAYDHAIEMAASGGVGFIRVDVDYADYDSFDKDIRIERVLNPLSVLPDPYATRSDGFDWNGCFVFEELSKEEYKRAYPKADHTSWEVEGNDSWMTEESIIVAEFWSREQTPDTLLQFGDGAIMLQSALDEKLQDAQERLEKGELEAAEELFILNNLEPVEERETTRNAVTQYILSGKEILEENEWAGRFIPIIPVYGEEVVVENKRLYLSMFHHAKDPQVLLNYFRTAEAEEVAQYIKTPWIGPEGAFNTDRQKWRTANTKAHPYIQYNIPEELKNAPALAKPERQPPSQLPAGAASQSARAYQRMKDIIGIQDAGLGQRSNEVSGVAIEGRKLESDTSNFHVIDNLTRGINQVGRVVIDLIPHTYNKPRVARTLGLDGESNEVKINQEFTGDDGVTRIYDMTAGKYDLVVKAGPAYSTQRKEALANLMDLVKYDKDLGKLLGDIVARNMDFPGADEVARRLKTILPPEILKLDDMKDIDDDAKPIIANLMKQLQQMGQTIEMGKGLMAQKDTELSTLYQRLEDKGRELDIKDADSKRRHKASQDDTLMDGLTTLITENNKQQIAAMSAMIDELRQALHPAPQPMQ